MKEERVLGEIEELRLRREEFERATLEKNVGGEREREHEIIENSLEI